MTSFVANALDQGNLENSCSSHTISKATKQAKNNLKCTRQRNKNSAVTTTFVHPACERLTGGFEVLSLFFLCISHVVRRDGAWVDSRGRVITRRHSNKMERGRELVPGNLEKKNHSECASEISAQILDALITGHCCFICCSC